MKVGKPASRSGSDIHKGRIARASIFSKPGLKAQAKRKGFQRGLNLRSHDSNDATQKVTTLWKANGKGGWKIRKDLPTHLQSFETLKRKPHECSWFEKQPRRLKGIKNVMRVKRNPEDENVQASRWLRPGIQITDLGGFFKADMC